MADPAELPEPDRIEGAPHPRETHRLIGHEDAEAGFWPRYQAAAMKAYDFAMAQIAGDEAPPPAVPMGDGVSATN
ncbi:MAG: hypothetical protein P8X66_14940 [Maritimibacter sp.]